jgi:hypothetical protein
MLADFKFPEMVAIGVRVYGMSRQESIMSSLELVEDLVEAL